MLTPTRFELPPGCIRRSKRLIRISQSIPGIADLVSAYESAVTSFESRYDEWDMARSRASIALACQHEAQEALNEEMRGVGLTILKVSRGRRSSATYQNYFPRGYGEVLQLSEEGSLQFAAGLLAVMSDETNPEIQARRGPLTTTRAQLESAITARRAADDTRGQAKAILEEEKFAWRNAHSDFYFALRSRLPDRRKFVESLFLATGRRQLKEAPPAEGEKAASDAVGQGVGEAVGQGTSTSTSTGTAEAPVVLTITQPKPTPTPAPTPINITPISSSAAATTTAQETVDPAPRTAEGGAAA